MRQVLAVVLLSACSSSGSAPPDDGRPRIEVRVDEGGYHPSEVTAPAGAAIHLVLTRTTDEGCEQQVVFPDLGIRAIFRSLRPSASI